MTNEEHLTRVDPRIRAKVEAVLRDLRGHGWQPQIATSWRSLEEQRAKKAQGRSLVSWSYHNNLRGGQPSALAVDIIDRRYAWGIPQDHQFWRDLGSSAEAHGMTWGGRWKRLPDVAHIEVRGISLSQARRASG